MPLKSGAAKESYGMSKTTINFILDFVLAVVFLASMTVAAISRFVFPAPTESDGWTLLGLTANRWAELQFAMFFVFGVLALIHVMLHWSWVCGVVLHRLSQWRGKKVTINDAAETLIGVAILVGILHLIGAVVLAAMLLIEPPQKVSMPFRPHRWHSSLNTGTIQAHGWM